MNGRYWYASILVMFALCVFAFLYFYELERTRQIEVIISHQQIHARQAARSFDELFNKWNGVLSYLSRNREIILMDRTGKDELNRLLGILTSEVRSITRTDRTGHITFTAPHVPKSIGADISTQKHMAEILRTHEPVVSDVFNAVQGYQAIAIHHPVFRDGVYDGSLAFVLDFENIVRGILDDVRIGKTGHAWLLSSDGVELYCRHPEHIGRSFRDSTGASPDLLPLGEAMLTGREGTGTYAPPSPSPNGTEGGVVATYLPIRIGNTFWSVAVTYAEEEITASIVSFRNKLIAVLALALAGGVALSYFGIKSWTILREREARRRVEQQLSESEARYRRISTLVSDYVFSTKVQADGTIAEEWVAGAFESMTGYTFDEYRSSGGWRAHLHPDDIAIDERDQEALRANQPVISELRTLSRSGATVWVRVYAHPVWDEKARRLVGVYGAVQDITEQKKADELLRENEQRYRLLFEENPAPMLIYEPDTLALLAVNRSFVRHYGYSAEAALRMTLDELYPQEERDRVRASTRNLHGYMDAGEWHHWKSDGSSITVVACSDDLQYRGTSARVAVFTDVSDRKLAEEALLRSLKEKEVLLKEIHHRVKNNLQVISSLLSMQASQMPDGPARSALMESQARVRSIALVHERFYGASDLSRVDLLVYGRSLTERLAHMWYSPGVKFSVEGEAVEVGVDVAVPFALILNELLTNALKHAFVGREGGTVTVRIGRIATGTVELRVRDNGIGFPEGQDLYRMVSTGMTLIVGLLEQLSGTIGLERSNGSEFVVRFPA